MALGQDASTSPIMATDFYQFKMAAGYAAVPRDNPKSKLNEKVVFEMFVRKLPKKRSYLVVSGILEVIDLLMNLTPTQSDLDYLRECFPDPAHETLHQILSKLTFTGDLWALPEGSVVFAGEPILRVEAPVVEAQLVESVILHLVNSMTTSSTKAARITRAARGKPVLEFGMRRGSDSKTIRAAFVGGFQATSRVDIGKRLGFPVKGTMAHSWVMSHDHELEAFRKWRDAMVSSDDNAALVDTYDVAMGVRNAIEAFGDSLSSVRIDSKPLDLYTKRTREMLDDAGLKHVKIGITNDLDEYSLTELSEKGAVWDFVGVGSAIAASPDEPLVGGVYKLTQREDQQGNITLCAKKSNEKVSYPGRRQIYRFQDRSGAYSHDVVGIHGEEVNLHTKGTPLLVQMMSKGKLREEAGFGERDIAALTAQSARHAVAQLDKLPIQHSLFQREGESPSYPVEISENLQEALAQATR